MADQIQPTKNPAAVALGRLGGLKGGKARAAKLSAGERKRIAVKAYPSGERALALQVGGVV